MPPTPPGRQRPDLALVLGLLASLVRVEVADELHVGVEVAGRIEDRSEADPLRRVVYEGEDNRDVRAEGDVIEAGLPVRGVAARALRGQRDHHLFGAVEGRDHLVHEVVSFRSVERNATKYTHQPAEWRAEERVLTDPVPLHAEAHEHQYGDGKVPVGRVWGADCYEFGRSLRDIIDERPAHEAKDPSGEALSDHGFRCPEKTKGCTYSV